VASLEAHEYYAHPRNLFWDLMGDLFDAGRDLPYAQRCARLTEAGVAVWDVLHEADRPGSLDSAIDRHTLLPNDFAPLFAAEPELRTVAFNGQKAASLFRQRVLAGLTVGPALRLHTLPSTSPAHAGRTRAQKLALWREVAKLAGATAG
jgi:double-stranded uracil-DNA glycosylase